VEVASRGGNFLLNVGPGPDGTIQPEFTERLKAIGKWMETNGESIYGTTYGSIQGVSSLRTTQKGGDLYVHIFDWPGARLELLAEGLPKFRSANLLANHKSLTFSHRDQNLVIELPAQAPDADVTVIKLSV
jgi:alpha-L-fucosidase